MIIEQYLSELFGSDEIGIFRSQLKIIYDKVNDIENDYHYLFSKTISYFGDDIANLIEDDHMGMQHEYMYGDLRKEFYSKNKNQIDAIFSKYTIRLKNELPHIRSMWKTFIVEGNKLKEFVNSHPNEMKILSNRFFGHNLVFLVKDILKRVDGIPKILKLSDSEICRISLDQDFFTAKTDNGDKRLPLFMDERSWNHMVHNY